MDGIEGYMVIGVILGLSLCMRLYVIAKKEKWKAIDTYTSALLVLLMSIGVILFIGMFVGMGLQGSNCYNKPVNLYVKDLVAAKDNTGIEGHFYYAFLGGSGNIDSTSYYTFYVRNEYGGIVMQKTTVDETIIYEGYPNPEVYYRGWTQEMKPAAKNTLIKYFTSCDSGISSAWYELYVPSGSVTRDIKFDLQ